MALQAFSQCLCGLARDYCGVFCHAGASKRVESWLLSRDMGGRCPYYNLGWYGLAESVSLQPHLLPLQRMHRFLAKLSVCITKTAGASFPQGWCGNSLKLSTSNSVHIETWSAAPRHCHTYLACHTKLHTLWEDMPQCTQESIVKAETAGKAQPDGAELWW